mgnify:FL=1
MTTGRFITYCVLALTAGYSCLTFYPNLLFRSPYEYKNISLYTRAPLPAPADALLERVYNTVMSDVYLDPGAEFEIYLTGGYKEYLFLAPFCAKAQSCLHPVSHKVFIASSDLDKNAVYGRDPAGKPRVLENVMVHDLVLAQMQKKLGFISYIALRAWLKEGYAEHVARETVEMEAAAICGKRDKSAPLVQYLESRLMLDLVKGETPDMNYPELIASNIAYDSTRKRVMERNCAR